MAEFYVFTLCYFERENNHIVSTHREMNLSLYFVQLKLSLNYMQDEKIEEQIELSFAITFTNRLFCQSRRFQKYTCNR
jgi:hypothetical protein